MKLLTEWLSWWKPSRREHAFHCDLLLEPGEWVNIHDSAGHVRLIGSKTMFAKVHLSASWEFRPTEFAEEE